MPETPFPPPVIARPGTGRVLRALGDEVHFHLTGEHTGGQSTLMTIICPPGGGPPPHIHARESETFHVIEGKASFFLDGAWTEVPPGTTVFMPPGSFHSFKNVGDTPLRMMVSTSPSGFETFFARIAAECDKLGGPDMQRIVEISAEHGISFPPV
jgi:quercetin dioxygenase-like cupin family protein